MVEVPHSSEEAHVSTHSGSAYHKEGEPVALLVDLTQYMAG